MSMKNEKVSQAVFACTETGKEPVREWLKGLPAEERRAIGFKIKEAEFGWPTGMPLTKNLGNGLWEVRVSIGKTKRMARIIFGLDTNKMVLLHGFIKKTRQTPDEDIRIARARWKNYRPQATV
ncbi:MAG: type II toxin-antitoxin system RelE/ParE family toxin [Gammaproteobacteria bacterium]|nr:type II toxin-antitoxin system RelE/ParE family toxin [Gammaproteobacteria bacterium]